MVGGVTLCCEGMVAVSYGTSVIELYLTVRYIGGLGLVFNLQPNITISEKYLSKKQPVANGLTMAGS